MSQNRIQAYAAMAVNETLKPFEYDAGELGGEEVEIQIESCGICRSDLSLIENEWGFSQFPLVPGHEIIGKVLRTGNQTKGIQEGQTVGVGWYSKSCLHCDQCMAGDHNLCPQAEGIVVGRHGGFADKVRVHWSWVIPLPEAVAANTAGPLFCGGITVFNPIVQCDVQPTYKVGVIGIGGLGHMALKFLNKWGCEVTAFSSTAAKAEEAKSMGAHYVVNSREDGALVPLAGKFDFILVTVNVPLNWEAYLNTLAPRGRLHFVGAVMAPLNIGVWPLLPAQRSVSASPLGSPATIRKMLEFCARHRIQPVTEHYKMSQVNEALAHLKEGKARYRIILENDFS